MNKRVLFVTALLMLLAGLWVTPVAVQAQSYSLTYSGFAGTCSTTGFSTTTTATQTLPTSVNVAGTTTLDGVAYDTFSFSLPAGNTTFGTGFSRTFSPALGSSTYTFVFNSALVDPVTSQVYGTSVTTINCTGGVFSASNVFVPGTGVYGGPGIPSGYVLKYITCDVAVHNAPGGTPIGSNAVKAGQTFYVNPTPQTAADGTSWTQVFVSSTPDPWIPTRCVN